MLLGFVCDDTAEIPHRNNPQCFDTVHKDSNLLCFYRKAALRRRDGSGMGWENEWISEFVNATLFYLTYE